MSHEEIKNIIKKQKSLNQNKVSNNSNEYKLIKNSEHDEMDFISNMNKNSINDNNEQSNNITVNSKEFEDLNKEIDDLGMDNTLDVNDNNENMEDLKQQILDNNN